MGGKENLPSPGKNATSFSSTNQPAAKGRKKTKDIRKLIEAFGSIKAPSELREDGFIKHFMDTHGLKGTFNEVLVAKLYAIALMCPNPKINLEAIGMILNYMKAAGGSDNGGITINFITPPPINQEEAIDLSNDSWTTVPPVEEKED